MKQVTLYSIFIGILTTLAPQAKADTVDNFQVYLRDKLELTEGNYHPLVSTRKALVLTLADSNETLKVNYSHCIAGAADRKIVIWQGEELLFSRSFPDKQVESTMAIPLKTIIGLYNLPDNAFLRMYYYDDRSVDGVLIAEIRMDLPALPKSMVARANRKSEDQSILEWSIAGGMILVLTFMAYRKLASKPKVERWGQGERK
ncbi:MAG: hypothetical protein J7621_23225 [Niastella sp.]|nr:hypothetical protein [Niastella sp.]